MERQITILAVDDSEGFLGAIAGILADDFNIVPVTNVSAAMAAMMRVQPDLMLLDMKMPEISGLEFLRVVKRRSPNLPVLMLTSETDPAIIVEAMRNGASDYIIKSGDDFAAQLKFRISQVLQFEGMKKEKELLAERVKKEDADRYEIAGISPSTIKLRADIEKFKGTNAYILITQI